MTGRVVYFDYGNEETVNLLNGLYYLNKDLIASPPQAIECSYFYENDPNADNNLKQLFKNDQQIEVMVVKIQQSSSSATGRKIYSYTTIVRDLANNGK